MRAILDTEEDVIRDFEIEASSSLEELHDALSQSFGFAGNEMASFYRSDGQWNQGEEMPLLDMGLGEKPLNDKPIEKILSESENRGLNPGLLPGPVLHYHLRFPRLCKHHDTHT